MTKVASLLAAALTASLLASCGGPEVPNTGCRSDNDCSPGRTCGSDGTCRAPDAGPDGGPDAGPDAGAAIGRLGLAPATLVLDGVVGTAGSTSFSLSNSGDADLHYAVACTGGTPSTASGAIAGGDSTTITVGWPAWTAAGARSVTCTATTADGTGGPLGFTATVTVAPAPQGRLTLAPAAASTTAGLNAAGTSSFDLGNGGDAALDFAVACTGATPAPASGTIAAGATAPVSVAFAPFSTTGVHPIACTATTGNGAGGPLGFALTVNVTSAPVGHLTRTPAAVTDTGLTGSSGQTAFTLGNDGAAALDYAVTCTQGATPTPASGTLAATTGSQVVTVHYPTWTSAGTRDVVCTTTTANGSGGPLAFTDTVAVTSPPVGKLTLTPATRALTVLVNQTTTTTFSLGNSGNAALHAGITCTGGGSPTPTPVAIGVGASATITVAIPAFGATGSQTVVCTADPTDTSDVSLTFTATLTVSSGSTSSPCAKGGGWDDLNGLTGTSLRQALTTRTTSTHTTQFSYGTARPHMMGSQTSPGFDARKGAGGVWQLESVYSGILAAADGTNTPGNPNFNTEHTWPQSLFSSQVPMVGDLHHLYPTDEVSNGKRSNYQFDNVTSTTWDTTSVCSTTLACAAGGVSKLGRDSGNVITFEVRLKQRGDTARALFYFVTRYYDRSDTNPSVNFPAFEQAAMRAWSVQDPPDQWECDRNDAIEALQGNRNPFTDRPDFIDKIGSF